MKKFLLGFVSGILFVFVMWFILIINSSWDYPHHHEQPELKSVHHNPKSIHYSALGDYLVDENGNRTEIHGHPYLVCHREKGECTVEGPFLKAKGSTVWLTGKLWCGHDLNDWKVEVPNATCDLQ